MIGQQGKGVFVRDTDEVQAVGEELVDLRVTVQDLSLRLAKVEEQLATSTTPRAGRSSR
jgi:GntR family transcriptional regulator